MDDEESVLESYRQILTASEEDAELADILALADEREVKESAPTTEQRPEYKVLLADCGARAVELVRQEMAAGGRVAAGFFDMRMPGMDGYMTIKAIMELDPDIICTVVTAYTDRSVNQIRELFSGDHQDQLHYFKKPFDPEELAQSALNMTSAWNKKRRLEEYMRAIEMHKHGLSHILHAVGVLSCVPPQSLQSLLTGLLFQFMAFLEGENGCAVFWPEEGGDRLQYGVGRFENPDTLQQFIEQDKHIQRSLETNKCHIVESRCFVPLVHATQKLGAMYIESKNSLEKRVDRSLLEIFKTQMVQLILNSQYHQKVAKSEEEAVTDPLTGLYNRRVLMKILREELSRSQLSAMQLAVIMIDLDDFKKVNDRYGHEAGDAALQKVANVLRLALRTSDLLGHGSSLEHIGRNEQYAIRMGGEEFCAILLNTGMEGAKVVGERIRQNVAQGGFVYKGEEIPLFASLGIWAGNIEQLDQQSEEKLNEYIDYADNAMYQAKVHGKNQVVVFEAGMGTS